MNSLEATAPMVFKDLQGWIHGTCKRNGFWPEESLKNQDQIDQFVALKLMLVHSEITEAFEELRKKNTSFTAFIEELADAAIRLLDLSEFMGINLGDEIILKQKANDTRPYKHGKKF